MTVAIVTNTSWNIYNFRLPVVEALKKAGFRVVAIAPEDEYSSYLKKSCDDFVPVKIQSRGANPLTDLALIRKLYTIYKEVKPDCILHYTIKPNIYGTVAAMLLKIPCIDTVSGLGTVFLTENTTAKIAKILYRISFRYASRVLFQNKDDLNLFLNKGLVKKEITGLVPGSGIDLTKYKPEPFSRNKSFTFLMIARLLKDKGVCEYKEAATSLKKRGFDVKFMLAGSPGDVSYSMVESWSKEGIIEYVGFSENVKEMITKADCIVLPSYREGIPRTLLEGAAMAKPLIATDVPGCKELVHENKNGYLCRPKDAGDLAGKMEKMINTGNEQLLAFGKYSRSLVEKGYSNEIVADKYIDILRQTLN